MLAKVGPILLLTFANVRSGFGIDVSKRESAKNYCDFSVPQKLYDAIDLLRCMNQLASTLEIRENGKSTNQEYFSNRLYTGNEESSRSPWTDLIASLFNGDSSSTNQIPTFLDTVLSQYQPSQYQQSQYQPSQYQPSQYQPSQYQPSQYQPTQHQPSQYQQTTIGPLGSLGDLNINLFDALYSISRYDDLKCVPRILCEVASGTTPGESMYYDRGSNGFGDFGKNMILGLLTNFGFIETSPLLNFGKAALLGYTSRGSPRNCYQEYPKCPRNPDQLIDYLNNHNGGFFRFFNKAGLGNNPHVRPSYVVQRNKYFHHHRLISKKEKAPSPGFGKVTSDRIATGQLKLSPSILNDAWNHERGIFPEERIRNHINRIIFPNDVKSTKSFDTSDGSSKTIFNFQEDDRVNISQNNTSFDHQETEEEEKFNHLRTSYQRSEPSSRTFVFPHD